MAKINPDDIDDIDHSQISKITLKNGKSITIDETIPSKKLKKFKNKNYKISQKLINLSIFGKKNSNCISSISNFNSKNKICKNISFYYYQDQLIENNQKNSNNILRNKKRDILKEGNEQKKENEILDKDNNIFNYNDFGKNNKEEIEKINIIENDIDSNNEYKTIINEFDSKTKNKLILQGKIQNINILLNTKIKKHDKFDLTDHFNSLVEDFRKRKRDINNERKARYYDIHKSKNGYKNNFLLNRNYKTGLNSKEKDKKYLIDSNEIRKKDKGIYWRNNNLIRKMRDRIFKKNSSFDPKFFKSTFIGPRIILPSNKVIL
jgi:hypothetical protein